MEIDKKYMRRALELARHGLGNTSPNPMVGAVIVDENGRIIGEGYHRKCGQGHAEVNAVASVKPSNRDKLKSSTLYVTLEPCSHYGKTPPCSKLIIETGIPRVVVGSKDPFKEVSGRGIKMLRDAGVEVVEGLLSDECRELNKKFITAHECSRPFVTLKWAQSADGFMDIKRNTSDAPFKFSDILNCTLVHKLRSEHDAILVGSETAIADNPRLNCRLWPGKSPRPVVVDRRGRVKSDALRMSDPLILTDCNDINRTLRRLYNEGITSVLVEGGPTILKSFMDSGLWDEARVEIAPVKLGDKGDSTAPEFNIKPSSKKRIGKNTVAWYRNNIVKNL